MPGLTSPQNFPYPLYTEPVDVAQQIKDLADAINFTVNAQQTAIAAAAARDNAKASASANQTINDVTTTAVIYTTEELDSNNLINLGVDPTLIVPQNTGLYLVTSTVRFLNNTTGVREMHVTNNGVTIAATKTETAPGGAETVLSVGMLVYAVAGDFLQTTVFQSSGGVLDITDRTFSAVLVCK